ncbi:ImmA/IrrE family metallo-endopeptidase [Companilactobacillus zhachilii]|uniref:ImmA/IrrE family metallo-endopeptidase n=1 Tax=Companilactobacillus zhachilii TaxID=2304606 RepID=A0A386PR76_9LACO|nr:ImmA/IrrE family metallo-endopeptidase [Companilactobacillus zhachilii]AYE38436.1 ImmA/IrrE family metallo-endopeptidase [Companilactobacillus zhachilii]
MTSTKELNKLVFNIGKRYNTFDPFIWAEKLNLDIYWKNIGPKPLAKTNYMFRAPFLVLAKSIKYSNQRYFVLAHEIGHVLEHEGLSAYYVSNDVHKRKTEREADAFAMSVVTNLYIEENGHLPETYQDLRYKYGSPDIGD